MLEHYYVEYFPIGSSPGNSRAAASRLITTSVAHAVFVRESPPADHRSIQRPEVFRRHAPPCDPPAEAWRRGQSTFHYQIRMTQPGLPPALRRAIAEESA
jgi:hypothetical protein